MSSHIVRVMSLLKVWFKTSSPLHACYFYIQHIGNMKYSFTLIFFTVDLSEDNIMGHYNYLIIFFFLVSRLKMRALMMSLKFYWHSLMPRQRT